MKAITKIVKYVTVKLTLYSIEEFQYFTTSLA